MSRVTKKKSRNNYSKNKKKSRKERENHCDFNGIKPIRQNEVIANNHNNQEVNHLAIFTTSKLHLR